MIFTDHHSLTFALCLKPDKYSPQETRHLDFISQFAANIHHISGVYKTAADALLCLSLNSLSSPTDLHLLAKDQLC